MTAIETNDDMRQIPLNKLIVSDLNARCTIRTDGDAELQASLLNHGVLQNMVVYAEGKDKFAVAAGERRRRNLKALAKAKKIAGTFAVPCLVRSKDEAIELSLAENFAREGMHPADEYDAFKIMADQGRSIEEIAARFGIAARTVEQRLKLARVSPRIIAAFRKDEITLDAMMAFAVSDDHERQETVWKACGRNPRAHDVRRQLTQDRVDATDGRVRYVGLTAYEAAGGTVTRDLFGREGDCWIDDPALLDRLAMERIETDAAPYQAEGWKWASLTFAEPDDFYRLRKVMPQPVPLSDEDNARLSALAARYDELAEIIDSNEENAEAEEEIGKVESEMEAIQERERIYTDEQRAVSGIALFLAQDGTLTTRRGIVRPEDEKAARKAEPQEDGGDDGDTRQEKGGLSGALIEALEQHRSAGLQVALMGAPQVAFRVAVFAMVQATMGVGYLRTVTSIAAHEPNLAAAKESPAVEAMTKAEEAWGDRVPGEDGELWPWIEAQDETTLMDVLAFCVARAANGGKGPWIGGDVPDAGKVAQAAGLDMRDHWTATAEGYLGRVSKALILEAVTEAAGADAARRIAAMKKGDMARAAEELIAGKGWLPAILRTPGVTA